MVNRDLSDMRKDYALRKLMRGDLNEHPIEQFKIWFEEARKSDVYEPNAMALATVDDNSKPSCRIVLLKGLDHGFIFYTNYESRKGQQLTNHQYAATTFWWDKLERQVRVEGKVEKVDPKISDDYFSSRPKGSQISATASPQSQVVESYQQLVKLKESIDGASLTRPDFWGGYRLIPDRVEFWQGRESRFHDRFVYQKSEQSNQWSINRLAP